MSRIPLSRVPIKTEPIPPAILEEIETFEAEARRMVSGDVSAICSGPSVSNMAFTANGKPVSRWFGSRFHSAGLTANQLRRVAELTERYATGVGHVTTRQDIQLHFVEL